LANDRQPLNLMAYEHRTLLTCDRRLLMHAIVQHGYYPRSQNAEEQTIEVVRRFKLLNLIAPFTRCIRCNARLQNAAKADVIEELEPLTKIYYEQFRRCPGCGRGWLAEAANKSRSCQSDCSWHTGLLCDSPWLSVICSRHSAQR
jgi:uncharacterized protein